ncbi:MAG: hypothetical protein B7733_22440 [Myxococcales bacterium FL481]|nr:MAG: hypothetical protein B7733_22440 [Myxococcales bacterium FL481]
MPSRIARPDLSVFSALVPVSLSVLMLNGCMDSSGEGEESIGDEESLDYGELQVRSSPMHRSLFSEDFESGALDPEWNHHAARVSSRAAASGEYGVKLRRYGFIEFELSSSGYSSVAVSLAYRTKRSLDVKFAPSPEGPWTVVEELTSREWEHREVSLPEAANDLERLFVRFSLGEEDRFALIDDIQVSGVATGNPCETDADCTDGDACNGIEVCSDGLCQMGELVQCDDGLACNGEEICVDGSCIGGSPIWCPAHEICEEESAECATWNDPNPAEVIGLSALDRIGAAQVAFESRAGLALFVHTYRASNFDPATGDILFVVHGSGRTAASMRNAAAPVAERYGLLVVAVQYPEVFYDGSEDFTVGVGAGKLPTPGVFDPAEWLAPEDFTHAEIEHVFEAVREYYGGEQEAYYLYGHSAGAQFAHRLLTFLPNYRIHRVAASSAGWYTLPLSGSLDDANLFFPYGLTATPWEDADLSNRAADGDGGQFGDRWPGQARRLAGHCPGYGPRRQPTGARSELL